MRNTLLCSNAVAFKGYFFCLKVSMNELTQITQASVFVRVASQQRLFEQGQTAKDFFLIVNKSSNNCNPIVNKGMHELRRVVNAVIKQYGKPDVVRIEMARDLEMNTKRYLIALSERLEWLGSNSIKHNLIAVCLSKSQ
jgi:hypothetical protein